MPLEGAAEPFLVGETAGAGDLLDVARGVLQQAFRRFQAEQFDGLGRCAPGAFLVHAGEIAQAHFRLLGEAFHGQSRIAQILRQPQVQVVEGRAVLGLQLQQSAVLRLPAGALEVDHQLARRLHADIAAAVGFHQRQCQIDAGSDPCRSPDRALLDEDRVGVHLQSREALLQGVAQSPVGRGAAAVEQPGLGQQEGAAAHGGYPAHFGPRVAQPGRQFAVAVEGFADVRGARDDQGVDPGEVECSQHAAIHRQSFDGAHQSAAQARRQQPVAGQAALGQGLAGGPEHGLCAAQVEQTHLRICDEGDGDRRRCRERVRARKGVCHRGSACSGGRPEVGRGCGRYSGVSGLAALRFARLVLRAAALWRATWRALWPISESIAPAP
ncbi:hypothetical protein D3C76_817000 [compost metagenome]